MYSVILAGGIGERFWPLSRRKKPKQLLDLTGDGTMISLTVNRALTVSKREDTFVVTLASQRDAVIEAVGDTMPHENIIGEPVGRNTAASVGLAAVVLQRKFGNVPFLVLPADHLVDAGDPFQSAVQAAGTYVSAHDSLLTFGITPTRPETGYGYIRSGDRLTGREDGAEVLEAESFHEKPSAARAREFVADGSYLWNSGMFCWRTDTILRAISDYVPELYSVLDGIEHEVGTAEFEAVLNSTYPGVPAVSIDYAVMEKADNVVIVRGDFYWNDVGGWESIRDVYDKDEAGNVIVGEHVLVGSANSTVFSPERTVGLVGLDDVVVVDAGDAILVCARDKVQQVKEVVEILKKQGNDKLL